MAHRECGVALIIVLVLLMILTLLALAGSATATAELAMAGNEQYRKLASEAASNGIEQAMTRIYSFVAPSTEPVIIDMAHSNTTIRYSGEEWAVPQSSAEKLIGRHYTIESTGRSQRQSLESQTQGALAVVASSATQTYRQLGTGLESP